MEKLEIKQSTESSEDREKEEIRQEIFNALTEVRRTEIFDTEFLDSCALVVFGKEKTYKYQNQTFAEVSKEDFSRQDFMLGKRTDFSSIHPKREFEQYDISSLNDSQFLPFILFEGEIVYNEFIAHEMAHNFFDKQYIQNIGQYEERDGITDVSEEYRSKIKGIVIPLVKKHYPNLDIEKFSFSRQQIAEIFTLMHEREYCQRANENWETHKRVRENVNKFAENPEEILAESNKKHNRNCSIDDFYKENHTLSLVVSPILEREYPEWKERINLFWK